MTVTIANILERVEAAGVPASYVRKNIQPSWWDADCDDAANHNGSMMAIFEIELARTLGVTIEDLRNEDAELTLKLDYAPQALIDALKPERNATYLGLLIGNEVKAVQP